jgi:hypothetical protein
MAIGHFHGKVIQNGAKTLISRDTLVIASYGPIGNG